MAVRAVRGAITVDNNNADEIINATKQLLEKIVEHNKIESDDMISIFFTVTSDLDTAFPAAAARQMGWTSIALMCANEMEVAGSIERCIRIMLHINTDKSNSEIKHIYLKGAAALRPDIKYNTI